MGTPDNSSLLNQGNAAFRAQDYEQALLCYQRALRQVPEVLRPSLEFNIELTRRRLVARLGDAAQGVLQRIADQLRLEDEINVLTPHFDRDYYLANNPDIAQTGVDPVFHYCTDGWREGRSPHPEFSTHAYLKANEDIAEAGINPFLHWIVYGRLEGRRSSPSLVHEICHLRAKPGLFDASGQITHITCSVDIIVPIFNAFDDVAECFNRLRRNTPTTHRIILIDDASTDERVARLCDEFVLNRPNTLLLRNSLNQGFIASVNRGLAQAASHVVLLNTDAFVPENWLERLLPPILEDNAVASVTPLTNNGEIANVPVICKVLELPSLTADEIDKIAARFDPLKTTFEVPTGVGFCMAMSRYWLDRVPNFDDAFGRGYGEEVDWCQRVRALGGKHLLSGALFVEHRGGKSFGHEKQARIAANNKLISMRYPDYDSRVQEFVKKDPAIGVRLAIGLAWIAATNTDNPVPVYLAHKLGGGAEHWLSRAIKQRLKRNESVVVVRDGDYDNMVLIELHTPIGVTKGNVPLNELQYYIAILQKKEIIYSCLVGANNPLLLMEALMRGTYENDQFRILIHDYFALCPSYTLIGANGRFCGLPEGKACENCYQEIKQKTNNLSPTIGDWRLKWQELLHRANEIEVFSDSSRDILLKVFPTFRNKIKVIPHKMDFLPRKVYVKNSHRVIVGVLGAIGYQKGAGVLRDLAEFAGGRIDIVVIGEIDPSYSHPGIKVHGRYSISEVADLAERYAINRWFFPSICPETFSFVVRECLATGLPVFAFDLGAQAEALKRHQNGFLIDLDSDIGTIYSMLAH
jgi:GT2 family glycosyltransferase/glycosyltransferase involved in cell wall biosynthesis